MAVQPATVAAMARRWRSGAKERMRAFSVQADKWGPSWSVPIFEPQCRLCIRAAFGRAYPNAGSTFPRNQVNLFRIIVGPICGLPNSLGRFSQLTTSARAEPGPQQLRSWPRIALLGRRQRGDGVELGQRGVAQPLQVADDRDHAVLHAAELRLALLPEARHRRLLGIEVLAQRRDAVVDGLQALGELGAAEIVVEDLGFLAAAEVRFALPVHLDEHRAQRLGERPRGVEARHPDVGLAQERITRVLRHGRGDDHGELGADLALLVLELAQPRRLPGLGLLRLPEDRPADEARGRAHALDQVGAVDALRHRQDLVQRERALQQPLERELERLALELLRALLELALEIRGLAPRGLELRLPLRLAPPDFLAGCRARLLLDLLALGVEPALVLEVLVLARIVGFAELLAQGELLGAEPGERAVLRAQRFVQGLELDVELRPGLGRDLRLELLLVLGERAVELRGVALDRLPRDAFGELEAMVAPGASHRLLGLDDDRAGHAVLLRKNRGQ